MRSPIQFLAATGALGISLVTTGCAQAPQSTSTQPQSGQNVTVETNLGKDPTGFIYDKALVPDGASARVTESATPTSTTVTLNVRGLLPNRPYGAHVHAKPCGPTGDAAGPHYQHQPDPTKPSVDPAYANPNNEIWLDFTTGQDGSGQATSTVPWTFTGTHPGSVVIHAEHTQTGPGKAGTAGARAACVTVGF
jgi:Cu-Zn family superoxide dismutase